ncbi:MAG: hypothetical protein Q9183_005954, partial [Haloplaca sp. 2 TL-2023]
MPRPRSRQSVSATEVPGILHNLWQANKEQEMDSMDEDGGAQTPRAGASGATHAGPTHGPLFSEHYPWGLRTTADSFQYPPLPSSSGSGSSGYLEDVEAKFDPDYNNNNYSGRPNVGLGVDLGQEGFQRLTDSHREIVFTEAAEAAAEAYLNEDQDLYDSDTSTPRPSQAQFVKSEEEESEGFQEEGTRKTVTEGGVEFEIVNLKSSGLETAGLEDEDLEVAETKVIDTKGKGPELTQPEVIDTKDDDSKGAHKEVTHPKHDDLKGTHQEVTDRTHEGSKVDDSKITDPKTMADPIGAQSPSHSPRPPSPSPLPEVHLGAQSPSASTGPGLFQAQDDGK